MPSRSSLQIETDYLCEQVRLLQLAASLDRRMAASILVSLKGCLNRASLSKDKTNEHRLRAAAEALERLTKECS
jgi:hypothetical protein